MRTLSFSALFRTILFGMLFWSGCLEKTPAPSGPVEASVSAPMPPPPPRNPFLDAMLADYDRFFGDSMRLTQTPGAAVVIVKDGEVIFAKGYGVKAMGWPDSVDVNTVFRIGSLSKGFAGVLTGLLVQDGTLSWDDRVQDRYPDFQLRNRQQAARLQLWHLLSHTTGLQHHAYTDKIEAGLTVPTIIKYLFPSQPVFGREGETFAYQNVAFSAIEEVMRSATGKSYGTLLSERIFRPAGMRTASCDFESMRQTRNKALPHFNRRGAWQADTITTRYYNCQAAGGVNASIIDMGEWLKVLLGHRPDIVADSTLDRVFHPVIQTNRAYRMLPRWRGHREAYYAMGWRVVEAGGETYMYHGGYVNGFRGEIALNRRDGIGICVLFNAYTEMSMACVPAFFERWQRMKGQVEAWHP
jgi:beta-lactamase class C